MRRAFGLWLFFIAAGCGGGGRPLSGAAGSSAAGQGGSSAAGQGGGGASGQAGGTGGEGGQGGGEGCPSGSEIETSCVNGILTISSSCPPSSQPAGTCPYGCKSSGQLGPFGAQSLCNPAPVDGGPDGGGAGGQGGGPGPCSPGVDDNVVTTCVNGVLTVTSHCPPSSSPAGTCPYGCMNGGQFGSFNPQGLCNPAPADGGCDGVCTDARDGPNEGH